jgi:hypothetical protein
MQFANDKGEHFQFSNTILHQRFDELFPWSFIIADREFFLHNSLPKEYWNGRRYLYMVDQQIYDSVCKGEHKPRSIEHKSFPGVRIFRGYDSLIELIEEKCNAQPILIIGKEPWARLRYFIDQIRLTYAEHFETCSEELGDKYKFPLDRFQSFLNFNSVVKIEQSFKSHSKDDTQDEDDSDIDLSSDDMAELTDDQLTKLKDLVTKRLELLTKRRKLVFDKLQRKFSKAMINKFLPDLSSMTTAFSDLSDVNISEYARELAAKDIAKMQKSYKRKMSLQKMKDKSAVQKAAAKLSNKDNIASTSSNIDNHIEE